MHVNAFVVSFLSLLCFSEGHVVLTFPPARKYPLNFLDNLRTTGPCGIPKALGPTTSLLTGTRINVTWELAYPHRGGYQINLLNHREQSIVDLTPNNDFINSYDPTRRYHEIRVPNQECTNCSIQLIRQAGEWSAGSCGQYLFWSCADVNIVPNANGADLCNGFDLVDGRCACQKPYSGTKCQYKDDCISDADCSMNGVCSSSSGEFYQRRHCFCNVGFFGKNCEKVSPIKSVDVNMSLYTSNSLSNRYYLGHRILKTEREIEIVLRVQTETWIGIGWKPTNLRSGCQYFPNIPGFLPRTGGNTPNPEGEHTPNPEGEHTPRPEGEHTPRPEGEHTPNPEGEHTPNPEGEHTPKPEGEHTPKPEGEHTPKPEGEHTPKPEGEHTPYPEGEHTPNPEGEHTPKPEGEHTPKPEGEHTPYPEGEHTPKPEGEYTPTPEGEHTPTPEGEHTPNPEGEHTPKPEGEHTPKPEGEHTPTPEGEHTPKPEGEHTPNPEPEHTMSCNWASVCTQNPCDFSLSYVQHGSRPDEITFTFFARTEIDKWLAIGFSMDKYMANSDIYMASFDANQRPVLTDRHSLPYYATPSENEPQNVYNVTGSHVNGISIITFTRKRDTGDDKDFLLTDGKCWYIIYAWGGGYDASSGRITSQHTRRDILPEKVCFKPCGVPQPETTHKPEPENTVKPEPEKTSKPEPENTVNPEPEKTSKPEPENTANPEPEKTGKPEPEGTSEPEGEPEPSGNCGRAVPAGNSDTTGAFTHPMDCTDMIIGSAKGMRSNIGDYYTRDRSTPLRDELYGGTDGITAAAGYESNGVTTLIFRRKLAATERTDFSIQDALMRVIWAQGQDPGNYIHRPLTGIDTVSTASDPQFYKLDELKYHGHSTHRGTLTMNFFDGQREGTTPRPDTCVQQWGRCGGNDDVNCHMVTWTYNPEAINFTIKAYVESNQWLGIGFNAESKTMRGSDVIVGWQRDDGIAVIQDRKATGYSEPSLDSQQDVTLLASSRMGKVTTLTFTRKLATGDMKDVSLSYNCAYFIYAKGGTYTNTNSINYHANTPVISREKVCIPCTTTDKTSPTPEHTPHPEQEVTAEVTPEPGSKTSPAVEKSCTWTYLCASGMCPFTASYVHNKENITLTMSARITTGQWLAIGFSNDQNMANSDVYLGSVDSNQMVYISDRFSMYQAEPGVDARQDAFNVVGRHENGMTTISFSRRRDTGDSSDFALTDGSCYYILFAWGGSYNSASGRASYHANRRYTDQKICFGPCDTTGTTSQKTTATPVVTSPKPKTEVRAEFKIDGQAWNSKYNDKTSTEYNNLAANILRGLVNLFKALKGFLEVKIKGFRPGSIIVEYKVIMEGDPNDAVTSVNQTVNNVLLRDGTLEGYNLNKESIKITGSGPYTAEESSPPEDEEDDRLPTTLIIIIVVAGAGFLLVLILGTCNCIKNKRQEKAQEDYITILNKGNGIKGGHITYDEWAKQQMQFDNPSYTLSQPGTQSNGSTYKS